MCAGCAVCHDRDRDKEHSTIIFEGPSDTPLLRLGWNKQDPRYIATLLADSPKVTSNAGQLTWPADDPCAALSCVMPWQLMALLAGYCMKFL